MRVLLASVPRSSLHTLRELFPNLRPYSLQVLAGALEGRHLTRIVDLQNDLRPMRTLRRSVDAFQPDVIGISILSMVDIDAVGRMARELRALYGDSVRLVVGGQPVTYRPDIFLDAGFDVGVIRYGEETFPELLDVWESGGDIGEVAGIAFMDDRQLVRTAERTPPQSLDDTPMPLWDDLEDGAISPGKAASMELARGCPWRCEFCTIPDFNQKRVLRKSLARIQQELDILESKGVTEIYFMDDCFGSSPVQLRDWVGELERRKSRIRWGVQIRADIIVKQEDLIRRAAAVGLFGCVVGFEGYGADVFDNVSKGGRSGPELNRKASEILRENGVSVFGTHLYGAKGDGFKTALRTWYYGRKNSDLFRFTMYTPLIGSKEFNQLEAAGEIREGTFEDFSYAKYMVADERDPLVMQLGFYGLVLAHYLMPSSVLKMIGDPDDMTVVWNRRAYSGSTKFVLGQALGALRDRVPVLDRAYRRWAGWQVAGEGGASSAALRRFAFSSHADAHREQPHAHGATSGCGGHDVALDPIAAGGRPEGARTTADVGGKAANADDVLRVVVDQGEPVLRLVAP